MCLYVTSSPKTKASTDKIRIQEGKKKTASTSNTTKSASTTKSSSSSVPSPRMQYTCVQVLDAILRTGTNHFVQDHVEQFVAMLAPCFDVRAPEMQTLLQVFFCRLVMECSKERRENLREQLIRGMTRVLSRAVRDTLAGRGERAYVVPQILHEHHCITHVFEIIL